MRYATVAGCSHTAGVGVDQSECYVSVLAEYYNLSIVNQGVPGGSSVDVLMNIVDTVKSINKPEFIIAQWPNAIRKPIWINGKRFLQNINSSDESFKILLANDEENFYDKGPYKERVRGFFLAYHQVAAYHRWLSFRPVDFERFCEFEVSFLLR